MDQTPPPTADQLGISEVEYERIMRDLRRREQGDLPPEVPAAPTYEQEGSRRRWSNWWPFAVTVVAGLAAALVLRGSTPAPAYAFLTSNGDQPVTYSSCKPVRVAIYPAGGPPGAEALIREAVDRMRSATGLDIVVTGVFGGHAANWNFEDAPVRADDPISVSWQDGSAIAELTDHVAGLGGSSIFTGRNGTRYLGAGTIALSRDYFQSLDQRGDHDEELGIVLHEFGHVFGLDHVSSRREIMFHSGNGGSDFGPGDVEGLRIVGHGPCI